MALLYFIVYPLGRFFLESLRMDNWLIGGVAAAQWASGVAILGAVVLLVYRHRRARPASTVEVKKKLHVSDQQ